MKDKLAGKFIVLDGPDGCGKSTQTIMLYDWLKSQGVEVVTFRDPGGTAVGEKVREILLNPEHVEIGVRTELLLYMASRAQLWAEKIKPALEADKCVLLDRWVTSTCAYQGFAGGFGTEKIVEIAEASLERVWPDMAVVLDVDVETAARRMDRQLDRMEQKGIEYHRKVREGFLQLGEFDDTIVVVDAAKDVEQVHQAVIEAVREIK
ncbi:MAG: dTMP kinase [Planctomycetota bacterium]